MRNNLIAIQAENLLDLFWAYECTLREDSYVEARFSLSVCSVQRVPVQSSRACNSLLPSRTPLSSCRRIDVATEATALSVGRRWPVGSCPTGWPLVCLRPQSIRAGWARGNLPGETASSVETSLPGRRSRYSLTYRLGCGLRAERNSGCFLRAGQAYGMSATRHILPRVLAAKNACRESAAVAGTKYGDPVFEPPRPLLETKNETVEQDGSCTHDREWAARRGTFSLLRWVQ